MEVFSVIIFKTSEKMSANNCLDLLTKSCNGNEIFVERTTVENGQLLVEVLASGDYDGKLTTFMRDLAAQGSHFIRACASGDNDPEITLYTVDGFEFSITPVWPQINANADGEYDYREYLAEKGKPDSYFVDTFHQDPLTYIKHASDKWIKGVSINYDDQSLKSRFFDMIESLQNFVVEHPPVKHEFTRRISKYYFSSAYTSMLERLSAQNGLLAVVALNIGSLILLVIWHILFVSSPDVTAFMIPISGLVLGLISKVLAKGISDNFAIVSYISYFYLMGLASNFDILSSSSSNLALTKIIVLFMGFLAVYYGSKNWFSREQLTMLSDIEVYEDYTPRNTPQNTWRNKLYVMLPALFLGFSFTYYGAVYIFNALGLT